MTAREHLMKLSTELPEDVVQELVDFADQLVESYGCLHRRLHRDRPSGFDTGDYICADCREEGFGRDWPERERAKKRASRSSGTEA